jgi:hypothetical protein
MEFEISIQEAYLKSPSLDLVVTYIKSLHNVFLLDSFCYNPLAYAKLSRVIFSGQVNQLRKLTEQLTSSETICRSAGQ